MSRPIHEMESKWRKKWEEEGVYVAKQPQGIEYRESSIENGERTPDSRFPIPDTKFYGLVEFPYPSGDGLHVGHPRSYTAIDLVTRKKRMEGKNVLYPIGWDAFGLPTENYAIKNKIKPADATKKNIANFTRQTKSLGFGFDWSREVDTTDPAYFKWTQWQFLQFFKHGMAYKAASTINWCPRCKIGLANEEAQGGVCERCGSPVEKREKEQWMIRITDYAQRLLSDLESVNYLEKIKSQQINWIGRSDGAEIVFDLVVPGQADGAHKVTVFTTRPDTLFGATFLVISPELAERWMSVGWSAGEDVRDYVKQALARIEEDRTSDTKEKTGVMSGVMAVHPATGEQIPVWIADYVLGSYGTGAIMAVPAHDERDFVFAKKYGLPIRQVVTPDGTPLNPPFVRGETGQEVPLLTKEGLGEVFVGDGFSINSDFLNGAPTWKAKEDCVSWLEEDGSGKGKVTYKLRDWVFSRQRYWGEPIPLVHCGACAKKKQKALIIHGLGSTSESNWYKTLKEALEAQGFEVFLPNLPNSWASNYETDWMEVLKPYLDQLSENDVIVGHSLGGLMAIHAAASMKRALGHLYLVAPLLGPISDEDWERKLQRPSKKNYAAARHIWERPVPWETVTKHVGSVQVFMSEDDELVPRMSHSFLPEGWFIHHMGKKGHFNDPQSPELVQAILMSKQTGWIPVPDEQLPLTLPDIEAYEPTDTGESPLASIESWVNTTCPRCGGEARRETDTMPNWAGSSWYFLRYCDPKNDEALASKEALKYWMPVDLYNGGMEHTTLHLLYSRFWYKFLWDLGVVPEECGSEPYKMRRSHNMILGEGGVKMSKSKGNVVNPDDVVEKYGSDVFRVYEMFIGPYDQPAPWDTNGIEGVKRFLDKVWGVFEGKTVTATSDLETLYHQTVKKVSEGLENLQFNTSVSQLMILTNAFQDVGGVPEAMMEGYLKILAPFAPHLAEEIWREKLGKTTSIHARGAGWPVFDASKLQAATFELVVQVGGKVRDKMTVASDISEEEAKAAALASEKVQKWLEGKEPKQVVYVKGRLVSIVL